jgi:hypothetical protein
VTREEPPLACLPLEAVHLPVIDVTDRVDGVVRPAGVAIGRVVVRLDADVRLRVGVANGRHAVLHRDPVGAGERAEVGVEGAVLLHDDHDVADLVDPPGSGCVRVVSMARKLGGTEQQAEEEDACEGDDGEPLQRGRKAKRRI